MTLVVCRPVAPPAGSYPSSLGRGWLISQSGGISHSPGPSETAAGAHTRSLDRIKTDVIGHVESLVRA